MTLHQKFFSIKPQEEFWVDVYHLMNSIIQPRPIAWISSLSPEGVANLAPFSYTNICSMNPPIVSHSIFFNRDGSEKDTLHNIRTTPSWVVGTVSSQAAAKANLSSAPYAAETSEFEKADVTPIPRGPEDPPFIAESPVQLICELQQTVHLGEGAGVGTLVLGVVREIWLTERFKDLDWKTGVPPELMDNVGRMGGDHYTRTVETFQMARAAVRK
ncbi:MAG: flavin reductase family protein [Nitrospinaceae bacterium]